MIINYFVEFPSSDICPVVFFFFFHDSVGDVLGIRWRDGYHFLLSVICVTCMTSVMMLTLATLSRWDLLGFFISKTGDDCFMSQAPSVSLGLAMKFKAHCF